MTFPVDRRLAGDGQRAGHDGAVWEDRLGSGRAWSIFPRILLRKAKADGASQSIHLPSTQQSSKSSRPCTGTATVSERKHAGPLELRSPFVVVRPERYLGNLHLNRFPMLSVQTTCSQTGNLSVTPDMHCPSQPAYWDHSIQGAVGAGMKAIRQCSMISTRGDRLDQHMP
ncbi:hypothetical protein BDW02DRAFT_568676 [Decorospora gaudefroyi]|uniref:Uncharacterized protein n=1 Tax=Decorospora gaudefroyi TaxID=184978 RepID=A0A6A5KBY0_9PLEO|nr:hypothetical protein BDW02DRAFT_568676 [Decorospora gaudefroyi]